MLAGSRLVGFCLLLFLLFCLLLSSPLLSCVLAPLFSCLLLVCLAGACLVAGLLPPLLPLPASLPSLSSATFSGSLACPCFCATAVAIGSQQCFHLPNFCGLVFECWSFLGLHASFRGGGHLGGFQATAYQGHRGACWSFLGLHAARRASVSFWAFTRRLAAAGT